MLNQIELDGSKLYFAASIVLISLSVPYLLKVISGLRLAKALSRYPIINRKWDAAAKKQFTEDAATVVNNGAAMAKGQPFRVNDKSRPRLVLPSKYVDEIKNDSRLDFHSFVAREFFSSYPGFDGFSFDTPTDEIIFQDAVRTQLTQALALTVEPMAKETPNTLNLIWGQAPEWKEAVLTPNLLKSVARLTALVFLGEKFMDNPEWQHISVMYTVDVFMAAKALNEWPAILRPLVHWFMPQCRKIRDEVKLAKSFITPEVEKRRKELAENGGKPRRKVLDSVDWFTAAAKGRQFNYVNAELSLAMASIHTTTNTVGFAMFDLVENPEYIDALREEIKTVFEQEGKWEKSTLFKLKLMDSVLKESMRLHPHSILNMPREAKTNITLSDGNLIPKNAFISVGPVPMSDPNLYSDPTKFNGYRFLILRNAPGSENKHQFVTTSSEFTVFGHGHHACPGRFFASNEIKLLLAHMLMYYDWKLPEGQKTVQHVINGTGRSPNSKQNIVFKSRKPEQWDMTAPSLTVTTPTTFQSFNRHDRTLHDDKAPASNAGLPRTSTVSLQTALQILGYQPTYHTISDFLPNARVQGTKWLAAMQAEDKVVRQKILADIVKGYEAITDGPGCFFVEDWIEMFPDAKVILGLRTTPQAWLDSVNGSIGKAFGKPLAYYLTYFVAPMHYGFLMNNLWDAQTKAKYGVGVKATDFYDYHNDHIRRVVPKEKLLEFKAADGWGPLAEFLGKERPVGEYPHKNDSKAANVLMRKRGKLKVYEVSNQRLKWW
ncbi:hypothetical protein G7Y89_g3133 [Cudoniella acicularis]|uniref:Cytochrome P450 n=1 Tax=Cudoniella acicularis TaxID=354080 RepID=A0A8H4RTU0_9HELO|nr:hypothetical protein G7Y89_g3133 [Cudoniella acicularis]